jgi:precorrin-8X/cobalt-precorrin-8 methylmutase
MTTPIVLPKEIENESFRRIEAIVGNHNLAPEVWFVVRRMIHTSADFDYLHNVRCHPQAIAAGVAALKTGCILVTDVRMVQAGIPMRRLAALGGQSLCFMDSPAVIQEAARRGVTRASVAIEQTRSFWDGGVVAIGNAPTALRKLLELIAAGQGRPALIVGIPVGFVDAAESKEALTQQDCPYITSLGPKGGSPVTASVINALAIMALGENP